MADRRTYESLWVSGTAPAHSNGRVFVGRKGPRPGPGDPVHVAVIDASGEVTQRVSITPDLPDEAHATPDVVRTPAGYAVAAGPWLARLDTELAVQSTAKNPDIEATKHTSLVSLPDGFVAGFTEWLPNAFWTHFVGFDTDGGYRWHHEYNVNGSQALDFLVPDGDGGALAGGTFPWLAELDADGTFREVTLPDGLPEGVLNAGVRDGDGLVLCSGSEMVRLDGSYEIAWSRTFAALADEQVVELTATSDGGVLFSTVGSGENRIVLSKAGTDGTLRWSHGYRLSGAADIHTHVLVERAPGEYILAGGNEQSREGWMLLLSESRTPTATSTQPVVTYSTATPTASPPDTIVNSPPPSTTTAVPGFGAATAVLSVSSAVLWRLVRREDET
ncbi:MAG: hypothetical protein ABEH90_08165 [Halolamina sp.]